MLAQWLQEMKKTEQLDGPGRKKSDAPDKQVATDFEKDCLGCHIPARTTDWVYVQGYPVLAAR